MNKLVVYHNVRCSKSREACGLLKKSKVTFDVIEYLKTPLTEKQLKELLQKLNMKAEDLVRKKEELYKSKFKDKKFTEAEWIKILCNNPSLIERPIIVKGNKAIIGRPTEKIKTLL